MLIIVATSLIITYINVRERNLKAEKILLEKKVKERTTEVMHKNEELAKKNKDILDSINYAQRIQQAILPSPSFVKCHLPESFVFFRPKDIVSGDFYLLEMAEESVMFAVVDCTGHGVPGAFMSFLGHDGVQRAISEYKLSEPGKVLDKLNDLVQRALQSSDNPDVKDGMDIALCLLDPKTRKLQFAGANNPLYIIRSASQPALMRNDEPMQPNMELKGYLLYETKGNKQPIGAHINRVPFTTYSFEMLPGDTLYVFSDGFADQFGGPHGRKFLYSNLKTMLIEHQQLKLSNQMAAYEKIINHWIGDHEQIDDICLMGVRIT
jgi:serine phosphatase RsbU (regulator of sigma subunit)